MAFIKEIPLEEATGELKDAYESDLKALGYVANYTKERSPLEPCCSRAASSRGSNCRRSRATTGAPVWRRPRSR